jgi:pyruvate kinase
VIQDLQGPKIRLGLIAGGSVELKTDDFTIMTTSPIEGTAERIPTSYTELPHELSKGNQILIDEGRVRLRVEDIRGTEIHCRIVRGGVVASRKGIHLPRVQTKIPALTRKDKEDAAFGLALGVDFIALSFVRRAEDVEQLRHWMSEQGRSVPIISKIETAEALDHLEEILSVSDGIMVARGDLGVEASLELIPYYQKRMIHLANQQGKTVITATQMLESMIVNPFPTRAEITDIANSILDGTDVMMLSGETAVGQYPIETIETMSSIAATTEKKLYPFERRRLSADASERYQHASSMARLVAQASQEFKPKAIVVFTCSGHTASLIAAERPEAPIHAFTPRDTTWQRLGLLWGVIPGRITELKSTSRLVVEMTRILLDNGTLQKEDMILFLLGPSHPQDDGHSIRIARAAVVMEELE